MSVLEYFQDGMVLKTYNVRHSPMSKVLFLFLARIHYLLTPSRPIVFTFWKKARTKSKCIESRGIVIFCWVSLLLSPRFMSVRFSVIVMFLVVCDGRLLTIRVASVESSSKGNQIKYKDVSVFFLAFVLVSLPCFPARSGLEDSGCSRSTFAKA